MRKLPKLFNFKKEKSPVGWESSMLDHNLIY